jgi:hypothetical protein
MRLSKLWAKIWPWLAEHFFRLREIETFIEKTNERYLDAQLWASIQGITPDEAESELLQGVRSGKLQRCLLYEWSDSPVQFIVPEEYLGRKIRLSEIGYIGEDDRRQIEISPFRVRPVFIATAGEDQ